jgi:biotin operon repressor
MLAAVADTDYHGRRAKESRQRRDDLLRQARVEGFSLGKLAELTGLSRAQVQRICDLSKDGGTLSQA